MMVSSWFERCLWTCLRPSFTCNHFTGLLLILLLLGSMLCTGGHAFVWDELEFSDVPPSLKTRHTISCLGDWKHHELVWRLELFADRQLEPFGWFLLHLNIRRAMPRCSEPLARLNKQPDGVLVVGHTTSLQQDK